MAARRALPRPGGGRSWRGHTVPAALAVLGLAGCGVGLAACGGVDEPRETAAPAATSSTGASAPTTTRTASPTGPRRVRGAALGSRLTLRTHGADLTVTVQRVSVLHGTHTPALPGTRQVGVFVKIANQSGQTYDSTSSGDLSLVLSAGQATPLDVRAGVCTTPLVDFESMIESGDVRSGCAAFSVPRGARVLGVRFSPHGRPDGTVAWRAG